MEYYKATANSHILKSRKKDRLYSLCGISNFEGRTPNHPEGATVTEKKPYDLCLVCAAILRGATKRQRREKQTEVAA